MSADIVNLRRARKQRARAEAAAIAAANRTTHGVPTGLRRLAEADERRRARDLEAHRLDATPPPDRA